jgi:uncharacterized protein
LHGRAGRIPMIDLLKLLVILSLTVFLLIKKWDLGLVLFLNSGLVALLFAFPALDLVRSMLGALVARDTLDLAVAVYLVLLLAELMRHTHAMDDMVAALQRLVPDSRVTLAMMPLMIGLMPMLGGAMFSAPMVNEVGERLHVSPERKTFINYWFRHSMEYVFPLYSSLLMMAALLGVSVFEFIQVSWPLTFVALGSGVLWGIVGMGKDARAETALRAPVLSAGALYSGMPLPLMGPLDAWRRLVQSTWPLLLVILSVVVLKVNMGVSLIGVIVLFLIARRIGPRQWWALLKRSFPLGTFSAIFSVMIFKHVLEDAGAVAQIPAALGALGLPAMLVAFVVPMMVGLLTGTAAAALALSVPLVAPLLVGGSMDAMGAGVWLFVGGFTGVLLSPLHLCLALTRVYFKASWIPLYRRIVPSVALVVIAAVVLVLARS